MEKKDFKQVGGRFYIKPTSARQAKEIVCSFCYKKPQTISEGENFSFKMGAWSKLIDQIVCPDCKGRREL